MQNSIIALIPAYKPGREMLRTAEELRAKGFEIVIVDDGSGEEYRDIFRSARQLAEIVVHPENRGKGAALKTGMRYIRDSYEPPYVVVTADADGQHKTGDILSVCQSAARHPDSLVLGSRRFDKDVPLRSRLGNTITRRVYGLTSGVELYDTQTGLRAFTHRLLPELLEISGDRYEYEMNMLVELPRRQVPIREEWIETVYLDGNSSSHFDTVKDSARIYRELLKYSAASFVSFLADYGLFCLFSFMSGSVVLSNIIARAFSSVLNFELNRRLVFRSKSKAFTSAVRYFTLAAAVLLCNTLLLRALTVVGILPVFAKLMTETILFTVSFLVQRFFVFRKEYAP